MLLKYYTYLSDIENLVLVKMWNKVIKYLKEILFISELMNGYEITFLKYVNTVVWVVFKTIFYTLD